MKKLASGWFLVLWTALVVSAMVAAVLASHGAADLEAVRHALRLTARTSLALFLLAFAASSLRRLWPLPATAWLLRNRRHVGVSFAASHFIHLGLVASLVAPFESVWRDAWPLVLATPGTDEIAEMQGGPDELDLQILSLLLAGASDARVARQLDVGLRTVQRRVRALMDATGATTRIQLGWVAHEKGWVKREPTQPPVTPPVRVGA